MHATTRRLGILSAALCLCGCYSTRRVRMDELEKFDEPVTCHIVRYDGKTVRAIVDPHTVQPDAVVCTPCVYEGDSWQIRFSGFPAVYSSGKYWRPAAAGGELWIPKKAIERVYVERLDWPMTIVFSPFYLPFGTLDFVARNARLGFEEMNDKVFYSEGSGVAK